MWLEERWGDRAAPVTDDKTKAPKPTSKLDMKRQDNCYKVPHPESVKLRVWAQTLPSSAVAETWRRNMCTSHAVLQICTHFFKLDKLLVLLLSAVSTQDKTTIICLSTFSHPPTSKHFTEGKTEAERAKMKEHAPLPPGLLAHSGVYCLLQAAHQLSAHHALNGHVRRRSWLSPRSSLTQRCRSYPNQKAG